MKLSGGNSFISVSRCRNFIFLRSATIATTWDLYDSLLSANKDKPASTEDLELVDFHEVSADISKMTDLSFSMSSTTSLGSEPGAAAR